MISEHTPNPDDNAQADTSLHYLDAISDKSKQPAIAWYIWAMVNNTEVVFKVDTGAEVTTILKEVYDTIGQPRLHKPTKFSVDQLDSLWMLWAELQYSYSTKTK